MAKKILELKNFMEGIIGSPSDADIAPEAAVHSTNIDAISEEGKLKGVKKDLDISDTNIFEEEIQLFPTSNTGLTASPLTENFKFKIYQLDVLIKEITITASQAAMNTRLAAQSVLGSFINSITGFGTNCTSVDIIPKTSLTNDAPTAVTQSTITAGINASVTTIPVASATGFYAGQSILIGDEIITIESIASNNLTVIREENNTLSHSSGAEVKVYPDFNVLSFNFENGYESFRIEYYNASNVLVYSNTSVEKRQSIELSPKNMLLVSAREEDATKTYTNVVVYDKNIETEENQIKVVENFYAEDGKPMTIVTSPTPGEWEIGTESASVSLDPGPNSVYIGTGNQSHSESKWFGKIEHKPFNQAIEGYHLEDARLEAIDEGNTVFNMNHMHHPVYAETTSGTPNLQRIEANLLGISDEERSLYAIKNDQASGQSQDLIGKQHPTEGLGYIPGAIYSSEMITTKLADSTQTNTYPYSATWNWTTNPNNYDTAISGHIVRYATSAGGDPNVMTTYNWVAESTSSDIIKIVAIRYIDDKADTQKIIYNQLDYFRLDHYLVTTEEMNTHHAAGSKVYRKPPIGAYISDLYEKNGFLYVLYSRSSGFTHDQEWLYSINLNDISAYTSSQMGGASIQAKPITPSYRPLTNYAKDYRNAGKEWWLPSDVLDGGKIDNRTKVGKDGIYSVYSNQLKFRNTDILGFLPNGEHSSTQVQVDANLKPHNTENYWNKHYAEDDGDQTSRIWGWDTTENDRTITADNPYIGNRQDGMPTDLGYSYGFKEGTYRVYPHKKGLTNYRDSNFDIGVLVYLEGEQMTSNVDMKKGYKRVTKWDTAHKYNYLYNSVAPTFKTWNDNVIMSASIENHGALQRGAAKESELWRGVDVDFGDGLDILVSYKLKAKFFDGMYDDDWTNSDFSLVNGTSTETNHVISGRVKRVKSMLRGGSIWNNNISSGSGEQSSQWQRATSRTITQLETAATPSTQTGNNHTTQPPAGKFGIISISKGEKFSTAFGSAMTLASNDKIYLTGKNANESQNNTLIYKWNKTADTNPYTDSEKFLAKTQTADSTFGPLRVENVGNSILSLVRHASGYNTTLYTTAGHVRNGSARYNASGEATIPANGSLYDTSDSEFFYMNPGSNYAVGISIEFQTATEPIAEDLNNDGDTDDTGENYYKSGNFNYGETYYYKIALVYDGYQEGPLQFASMPKLQDDTNQRNFLNAQLTLVLSNPPKRVSHLTIYRRNNLDEFYRLVTEVPLEGPWSHNSVDNTYSKIVEDTGVLGPTYEAVTGMPETLEHTNLNYNISCNALGHLIVGDCYHPEIKQSQNFIFKSQPQAYSNFNWSKDYCVLPNKPTALKWFAGKLYAFDLHNMWRINLDTMVIEDYFEGIGCIGPESITVTDIGMFFCDYQGMYWHNGQKAENVSRDVLQNSAASDLEAINPGTSYKYPWSAWQTINHKINPHLLYDPKDQSVYFCFINQKAGESDINGAWKLSITRKRWDFILLDSFKSVLTGNRNDIYLGGDLSLIKIGANEFSRKDTKWVSKSFNMGSLSEEKVLNSIKIQFNTSGDATAFNSNPANFQIYLDNVKKVSPTNLSTSVNGSTLKYMLKGNKKFKKLRFEFIKLSQEVDSVSIIYRSKSIK